MALGERCQVVGRRPGERVDRLVLVADDADVRPAAGPQLEQALLERVRVLVFVDAEPALAGTDDLGGVRVTLEEVDSADQHVVEVEAAGSGLRPLVVGEDADEQIDGQRRFASGRRGRDFVARGIEPPALRPLDLVGEVLRRREAVVAGQAAGESREDRQLRAEDLRQRRAVMAERPEMAELAEGMGMERPGRYPGQAETPEALHHLAGGLVRERDDEDLVRGHDARGDRERRPPADHPGLARSCPGDDRDRPVDGADRVELGLVQVVEEVAWRREGGHRPRLAVDPHRPLNRSPLDLRRVSIACSQSSPTMAPSGDRE